MYNANTMKQWPNTASEANLKKIMCGNNAISEQQNEVNLIDASKTKRKENESCNSKGAQYD